MDTVSGYSEHKEHESGPIRGSFVVRSAACARGSVRQRLLRASSFRSTITLGAVAMLAACTTTSNMPPAPPLPDPTAGSMSSLPAYRIQVGDILDVRLMLNPEL